MFNIHDLTRNEFMLTGPFARQGYDWWWHSFTGVSRETGKERTFFIEFFVCNPALAESEPVFGSRDGKRKPSYDAVQIHRFFSLKEAEIRGKAPFHVRAGNCFVSDTELRGSVHVTPEEAEAHPEYMCGAGDMSWDLYLKKEIAYNVGYGAGKLFRSLQAFEMYWHAEGMKTAFSGAVVFNGEVYRVSPDTCCGYSDKNWGSNFTSPWLWLSSGSLYDAETGARLANSVFDIGGGCPKVFGVSLPHYAASQLSCGTQVSIDSLAPGDLVFFSSTGGEIDHVAIYVGGGSIVHAANSKSGICYSSLNWMTPVAACRVV